MESYASQGYKRDSFEPSTQHFFMVSNQNIKTKYVIAIDAKCVKKKGGDSVSVAVNCMHSRMLFAIFHLYLTENNLNQITLTYWNQN